MSVPMRTKGASHRTRRQTLHAVTTVILDEPEGIEAVENSLPDISFIEVIVFSALMP